ncbi:MAG: threonine--tRNA ligase [Candidatus Nomurabacteria bacterium]|nr:threonine--tRNA ligase [Candidatus Nomurabacteria bacterium]
MENDEHLAHIRHTLAHLLAQAAHIHYPNSLLTLGPSVDNGFYYDIDFGKDKISDEDLVELEKTMKKNLSTWIEFTHKEVSGDEAKDIFKGNLYKLELIEEIIARGEKITLYTCGGFTDLCRGGHAENPSKEIPIDSFKLERIAGAYWRGNEKNKMLTRIYGLSYKTKAELDAYILQQEEAKKRDHRKIGKELKLFTLSELVGAGLPLLQPKGMIIRKEIEDYLWELHKNNGYSRVWTPHIAKQNLYETSGHAAKFGAELFRVKGGDEEFFMKPMNCPHHMQIFADNQFSYRDMPVRYFEPATVYRYEKAGQLSGLTRVRAITQDDGHLFCRVSQIGTEVSTIVSIIKSFYTTMGMMNGYWVRLSVRGDDKSKYLGTDEVWEKAESALEIAAKENELNYKIGRDEAAFYGPKLDFMFKDAIGREWQLATIQCDFNLPERFELKFINESGVEERPVVIHRAISGSLERFMGVMIEHFAGAFPLWLSPVQVVVLPISEHQKEYGDSVFKALKDRDIRVEIDDSNESLGKRIRNAKMKKVPYVIVIGDKEKESGLITVEGRTEKLENITTEAFLERLSGEIKNKTLN